MTSTLAPGISAETSLTVTRELTADSLGNPGVLVYATPCVIALLESRVKMNARPMLEGDAARAAVTGAR